MYLCVKCIFCIVIFLDPLQLPYELPSGHVAMVEKDYPSGFLVCLIRS